MKNGKEFDYDKKKPNFDGNNGLNSIKMEGKNRESIRDLK